MKQERGANGAVLIQIKKSQEFSEHKRGPVDCDDADLDHTASLVTNIGQSAWLSQR